MKAAIAEFSEETKSALIAQTQQHGQKKGVLLCLIDQ